MKYVFFGSPRFAEIILEKLIAAKLPPEVIICNPDRPVGRKKVFTPPLTKVIAQKCGIAVLQPNAMDELKAQSSKLKALLPDFAIVAAYSKIIPKEILTIPRLGTIGVHPSLLPKYRGASPIQSAILHGEEKTGVTLYLMDEKVDHGPVLAQKVLNVGYKVYIELEKDLASLGADLLIETIPKFLKGEMISQEQNHTEATFTKKFTTEDGYIPIADLEIAMGISKLPTTNSQLLTTTIAIERKIRALNPEPGVWTLVNERVKMKNEKIEKQIRIKLLEVEIQEGKIVLKKIQKEGGKPISGDSIKF